MRLESLIICEQSWGAEKGTYKGTIKYSGQYGTVEVQLTHAVSQKLLAVVAEDVVTASKHLAANLTAEVINQTASLEAPKQD